MERKHTSTRWLWFQLSSTWPFLNNLTSWHCHFGSRGSSAWILVGSTDLHFACSPFACVGLLQVFQLDTVVCVCVSCNGLATCISSLRLTQNAPKCTGDVDFRRPPRHCYGDKIMDILFFTDFLCCTTRLRTSYSVHLICCQEEIQAE